MMGQTVFYRLSEQDTFHVRNQRELEADLEVFDGTTKARPFHGDPVEIGQLLPAEVVRAYSEFEAANNFHTSNKLTLDILSRRNFSGFADIRVKLPGNDVLWVPRAERDENPVLAKEELQYGIGKLVLPDFGKFMVVMPPSLI